MKNGIQKNNFSDMTTAKLIKKKKSTSFATGLLAGVLIFLFMTTIFQTITKGATPFLAVPFAFLPLLVVMYGQVKSINKELKSRKLNL